MLRERIILQHGEFGMVDREEMLPGSASLFG